MPRCQVLCIGRRRGIRGPFPWDHAVRGWRAYRGAPTSAQSTAPSEHLTALQPRLDKTLVAAARQPMSNVTGQSTPPGFESGGHKQTELNLGRTQPTCGAVTSARFCEMEQLLTAAEVKLSTEYSQAVFIRLTSDRRIGCTNCVAWPLPRRPEVRFAHARSLRGPMRRHHAGMSEITSAPPAAS